MADNDKDKPVGAGNKQFEEGFPDAPADSNVFPPGAPQTSHGSATGPVHSPEQSPGGDRNRQQATGGAAAGGQPGTSAPDATGSKNP